MLNLITPNLKTRCWKKKSDNLESENCTLALQSDHKVNCVWIVDVLNI